MSVLYKDETGVVIFSLSDEDVSGDKVEVALLNDGNPAELTGSGVTMSDVCSLEPSSSAGAMTELESVTGVPSEPDDSSALSVFDGTVSGVIGVPSSLLDGGVPVVVGANVAGVPAPKLSSSVTFEI